MRITIFMFLALTACAAGTVIGASCSVFQEYRLNMPDPTGASRAFLEWLNQLDISMLSVCKRGS